MISEIEAEPGALLELICEAARRAEELGRQDLLVRCEALLGGELAICRHGMDTWRGLSAELETRHGDALEFHERAERGWAEFGNPYERAQAMLGEARCLSVLDRGDEAVAKLRQASEVFGSLGAEPALRDARASFPRGMSAG